MMADTPRVFVGSTMFQVQGMTSDDCLRAVCGAIGGFAGIRVAHTDLVGGLVTVTAERPVDRADIANAITQAGFAVLT